MARRLPKAKLLPFLFVSAGLVFNLAQAQLLQWTYRARIAGIAPSSRAEVERWVNWAARSNVNALEVDLQLTERYDLFENVKGTRDSALVVLRGIINQAHAKSIKVFAYLNLFEIITPDSDRDQDGRDDDGAHSIFTEHPQWLQKDIDGKPAVFYGKWDFWLEPSDESAWVTPYHPQWKARYLQIIKQVVATGVDAIFIDEPYLMTTRKGWYDSWASFDPYMTAACPTPPPSKKKLGNFDSPRFREWVKFRFDTITHLIAEINATIKSLRANTLLIVEEYPGLSPDAVTTAADPYRLATVSDLITHEFSPHSDACHRGPYQWLFFYSGLYALRAIDNHAPTWILTYVDREKDSGPNGDSRNNEALANLANAVISAGCNFWETGGAQMNSTSTNLSYRAGFFDWLHKNQRSYYVERKPHRAVGVYFSPSSRDYGDWAGWGTHLSAFRGALMALLEGHLEIHVVTPRNIINCDPVQVPLIILPHVSCISEREVNYFKAYLRRGGKIINYGKYAGWADEKGNPRDTNAFAALAAAYPKQFFDHHFVSYGQDYFNATIVDTAGGDVYSDYPQAEAEAAKARLLSDVQDAGFAPDIDISAPPLVTVQPATVGNGVWFYLVNFDGVRGNRAPSASADIVIKLSSERYLALSKTDYYNESSNIEYFYDVVNKKIWVTISGTSLGRGTVLKMQPPPLTSVYYSKKPTSFGLFPSYTGSEAVIRLRLPTACKVTLKIFDLAGKEVKTLMNEPKAVGYYTIFWNGKDTLGRRVVPGMYFCRMETKQVVETKKLLIVY